MRNFTRYFVLAVLLIAGKLTFGQGFTPTGLTFNSDTYTSCDSVLSISFSAVTMDSMTASADVFATIDGTGFAPCNLLASINWGDGTSATYTGYAGSAGSSISFSPSVEHMFATPGSYSVFIMVTNLDNNMSTFDTLLYNEDCGNSPTTVCYSAYLFCDANANGQLDSSEDPLVNAPVTISTDANTMLTVFTDTSGMITFCTQDGSSSTVISLNTNWLYNHGYTLIDSVYYVQVSAGSTGYFGVNCNGGNANCSDLHVNVLPWIGYYQNYSNVIRLNFGNYYGSTAASYQLSLTFPSGVTPVTSTISIPGYTISGNTITWNLTNAYPGYAYTDYITFSVPGGISNGTVHQYTANITASSPSDCYTGNDSSVLIQVVGTSYDPNDKIVDHETNLSPAQSEYLTYTINFQNTGTAPAQDIYILDTLSSNLNWSTLEVIDASHTMQIADLGNGVKRFQFPQIWLPDATSSEEQSHGYVTYRIRENDNLPLNSWIYNTAYIFFDANAPIVTNTTANVNAALKLDEETLIDFYVYPNPSSSDVTVEFAGSNAGLRILDLTGKVLANTSVQRGGRVSLDGFQSGIYLFELTIDGSSSLKRIVKR